MAHLTNYHSPIISGAYAIFFSRLGTLDMKINLDQSYFNRMQQICDLTILEEKFTYFSEISNPFLLIVVKMAEQYSGCCTWHILFQLVSIVSDC